MTTELFLGLRVKMKASVERRAKAPAMKILEYKSDNEEGKVKDCESRSKDKKNSINNVIGRRMNVAKINSR